MSKAVIVGTGSYLPPQRRTNKDLERVSFINKQGVEYRVEAHDVLLKTGVETRHIAHNETTSDLATRAGTAAMKAAKLAPEDIDLLLLATSTPDYVMPKTAARVAHNMNLHGAAAYDAGKDSTGFLEALEVGTGLIESGRYENILVIAAECLSPFINPTNKGAMMLYGDGAGAVVLQRSQDGQRGVAQICSGSEGSRFEELYIPQGGSVNPRCDGSQGGTYLHMEGRELFEYGSQVVPLSVERVLSEAQMVPDRVDWLVPHQSNMRVIENSITALGLSKENVLTNLRDVGNTCSASIPIMLDQAVRAGTVKSGQVLVLVSYGAGLNWMSVLIHW